MGESDPCSVQTEGQNSELIHIMTLLSSCLDILLKKEDSKKELILIIVIVITALVILLLLALVTFYYFYKKGDKGRQCAVCWMNAKIFQTLSISNKLKSSRGCRSKTNYSVLVPRTCPRVKFYTQITSDAVFIFRQAKIENEKSDLFRIVSSLTNCRFLCHWRKLSFSV